MLNNIDVLKGYLKGVYFLDTPHNTVEDLVDDDSEYISLNFDNPELEKLNHGVEHLMVKNHMLKILLAY